MATTPRGIRNNNPGNIRYNGAQWLGLDDPPTDGAFCRFADALHGIRALARTIMTYESKYGLNTIRGIITRFAPPCENDTGAYVAAVCLAIGCQPDDIAPIRRDLWKIIRAIIRHENGECPYSNSEILAGIRAAE